MRVGLMVNPTAGKGRGAAVGRSFVDALRAGGHEVVDVGGRSASEATAKALAARDGLDSLAVVGGDGMAHLGVNLVAGTALPLAVVAAGTGNDIARELRLPLHDPLAMAALMEGGSTRTLDAARVTGPDLPDTVRWYAAVLSAGFDAIVNERANRMSWPRGRMRYNLAIARELPVFRPIHYSLDLDGTTREVEAMLVAVANGPSFGGGMRVCPDAAMDDGLLDVLVVHKISVPELLRVFPKVYKGTHVSHPQVEIVRARAVTLQGPSIAAYADGERVARLPLTVTAVPGALTLVVP